MLIYSVLLRIMHRRVVTSLEDQLGSSIDESLPCQVGRFDLALVSELGEHFNGLMMLFFMHSDNIESFFLVVEHIFVWNLSQIPQ